MTNRLEPVRRIILIASAECQISTTDDAGQTGIIIAISPVISPHGEKHLPDLLLTADIYTRHGGIHRLPVVIPHANPGPDTGCNHRFSAQFPVTGDHFPVVTALIVVVIPVNQFHILRNRFRDTGNES